MNYDLWHQLPSIIDIRLWFLWWFDSVKHHLFFYRKRFIENHALEKFVICSSRHVNVCAFRFRLTFRVDDSSLAIRIGDVSCERMIWFFPLWVSFWFMNSYHFFIEDCDTRQITRINDSKLCHFNMTRFFFVRIFKLIRDWIRISVKSINLWERASQMKQEGWGRGGEETEIEEILKIILFILSSDSQIRFRLSIRWEKMMLKIFTLASMKEFLFLFFDSTNFLHFPNIARCYFKLFAPPPLFRSFTQDEEKSRAWLPRAFGEWSWF